MKTDSPVNTVDVMHRLLAAGNAHDLPAFLGYFAEDYLSEQPNHPGRAFRGRSQVEKNWSAMFAEIPDFHMDLLNQVSVGNQVWVELDWTGTLQDNTPFHWRGISIFTIEGEEVTVGRLYMAPVEEAGPGIDETVRNLTGR